MNNVLNYLYDQADDVCSAFYELMEYLQRDQSVDPGDTFTECNLITEVWRLICNLMVTFDVLDLKGVEVDE